MSNLIEIENLVNSYSNKSDEVKKELRTHKEMLNTYLEKDDEYQKLCEEINKLSKLKRIAKQKVLRQIEPSRLVEKIKDYQSNLKEMNTALSEYLSQYCISSGTNQIELKDGTLKQIIHSAKLVRLQ